MALLDLFMTLLFTAIPSLIGSFIIWLILGLFFPGIWFWPIFVLAFGLDLLIENAK